MAKKNKPWWILDDALEDRIQKKFDHKQVKIDLGAQETAWVDEGIAELIYLCNAHGIITIMSCECQSTKSTHFVNDCAWLMLPAKSAILFMKKLSDGGFKPKTWQGLPNDISFPKNYWGCTSDWIPEYNDMISHFRFPPTHIKRCVKALKNYEKKMKEKRANP